MVHRELIKTLEQTHKTRIAFPHIITKILQTLAPLIEYEDESITEPLKKRPCPNFQELLTKFKDVTMELPTIPKASTVDLDTPPPTPIHKALVKPKARKVKMKIA